MAVGVDRRGGRARGSRRIAFRGGADATAGGACRGQQQDKELARAIFEAYNDWHIDGWCGAYPGRFIPLVLPMMWDPELLAGEVRRVARKGCHAMTFSGNPAGTGYPSLHSAHWDPYLEGVRRRGHRGLHAHRVRTGMSFDDPDSPAEILIASAPSGSSTPP